MNCHRSEAHGMIPAEIMLGRKLFLPFEIEKMPADDDKGKILMLPKNLAV